MRSAGMLLNWCPGLLLFLALTNLSYPASALTRKEWSKVCTDMLGLRSGTSETDVNNAGYGMDNGNKDPKACLSDPPKNWDDLLKGTLKTIKSFKDSDKRYLLVVTKCPGLSSEYEGAFPKCNKMAGKVIAAIGPLAKYNVEELVKWVNGEM